MYAGESSENKEIRGDETHAQPKGHAIVSILSSHFLMQMEQ